MMKSICKAYSCFRVSLVICLISTLNGCVNSEISLRGEKSNLFNNYDTALTDSVTRHWYALLDKDESFGAGKVVLSFHLNDDGSITDMKVLDDKVGHEQAAICEKAVFASAPFPDWPKDMIRMVGANYRIVTNTFSYY